MVVLWNWELLVNIRIEVISLVSQSIYSNQLLNVDASDYIYYGARDWQRSNLNVFARVLISTQCCQRPEGLCMVNNEGILFL